MIIVRLLGGMGNHLFQYAATRRLALLKQVPLKLDMRCDRACRFEHFNFHYEIATPEEIAVHFPKHRGILRGIQRDIYRQMQRWTPLEKRGIIEEAHYHYDPNLLRISGHNYLIGYWQSERYFADIADLLRDELRIISEPDDANKAMLDTITGSESVGVHIRRGDYVSSQKIQNYFGVCTVQYYQAALDLLLEKVEHPHIFVFSDDIPWTREHLRFAVPMTFVDHNDAQRDYEDLRLLSHCRHHIIANSTFSWWGAWLAAWPGQVVIAPRPWLHTPKHDTRDVVPERWYTLEGFSTTTSAR